MTPGRESEWSSRPTHFPSKPREYPSERASHQGNSLDFCCSMFSPWSAPSSRLRLLTQYNAFSSISLTSYHHLLPSFISSCFQAF
ncbi:hypothetical protein Mapa_006301 [Marchantia paleacea]|nr:hypothetical protein Mapa_006301 [Marchantia paleacea]